MGRRKGSLNKVKTEDKSGVSMSEETAVAVMEEPKADILENLESEVDRVRMELEQTKRQLEEKKQELKNLPAREYDKKEIDISEKQIAGFAKNNGLKEKIEAQKAYDDQLVTGKFINRRAPGQRVKLTYMKYSTDPVKWYVFDDGKTYTIPRGFVEQIREYYHTPIFVQKQGPMDPNNAESQIAEVDTSQKKYDFVPLNF